MNTEFFTALELLEREKGIPQAYMMEKIEAALVSAFKKEYGNNTNVRVLIDPDKKDVRVYQQKLDEALMNQENVADDEKIDMFYEQMSVYDDITDIITKIENSKEK